MSLKQLPKIGLQWAVVLAFGFLALPLEAQSITALAGDVTLDGDVNVLDVQADINQSLLLVAPSPEGDVDRDGNVNIIDVQTLINIVLGRPVLIELKPAAAAQGFPIVIEGSNFSPTLTDNDVSFNGLPATVLGSISLFNRVVGLEVLVPQGVISGPITVTVGGDVSNPKDFTAVIPNVAPSFDTIPDQHFVEDDPSVTIPITSITAGTPAEDSAGQAVTLSVATDNPALVTKLAITPGAGTASLTFDLVANAFGVATVTIEIKDDGGTAFGGVDTFSQDFVVTVTAVNDAPVFDAIADLTVLEDSGTNTVSITGVSPGPANEATQTLIFSATSSDPGTVGNLSITGTGATRTLSFDAVPDAFDTVSITVTAQDNGGTNNNGIDSLTRSFLVTLTPVNDAPSFDAIADQTVLEDSGTSTVSITGVAPGPANEAAQVVSFSATSSDPSIVGNVTITGSGATRTLSFDAVPDAFDTITITLTAQDDGGTNNSGVDSLTRSFLVTLTPVNDAPVFDAIADQTVLEDSGTSTVSITSVAPGPANEAAQVVSFSATSSDPGIVGNVTVTGSAATRTLSFDAVPDAFDTITITLTAQDDGGTDNNGLDSLTRTFLVTLTPVNDAPSFDAIADQTVLEDSGTSTVTITGLQPGPSNESSQNITITAVSSAPALIATPTITGSGTTRLLSFDPATDAFGDGTITVTAQDDGGTDNNGIDSFSRSFLVTLTSVNDRPSFDAIADQTVLEDSGTSSVSITAISPGPANESSQVVSITALSSDQGVITNAAVSGNGATRTLSFETLPDAVGSATITVTAQDDGGTDNNGIDSFIQSFLVVVDPINDAPTIDQPGDATIVQDNTSTITLTGLSPGGGADEAGQSLAISVTSNNTGLFSSLTVSSVTNPMADLTLVPTAGQTGSATLSITVDDGQAANNSVTVTFVVMVIPNPSVLFGVTNNLFVQVDNINGTGTPISGGGLSGLRGSDGLAFDPSANLYYGVNNEIDQLFSFNAATGESRAIGNPLGFDEVRGLAFDPNSSTLYGVQNNNPGTSLVRIDTSTGLASLMGSPNAVGFPRVEGLAFDPNTNTLLGAAPDSDELISIDTTTGVGTVIGTISVPNSFQDVDALAFDTVNNRLLGLDNNTKRLILIDPATGAGDKLGPKKTKFDNLQGLAFDPNTNTVAATNTIDQQFVVLDGATGEGALADELSFTNLRGLAFDSGSNTLFGTDINSDRLLTIDLMTGVAAAVKGPAGSLADQGFDSIKGLAFDPNAQTLYGADSVLNRLIAIDPGTAAVTDIGALPATIQALAFDPSLNTLYGVNSATDTLVSIDTANGTTTPIGAAGGLAAQGFPQITGLSFDTVNGTLLGSNEATGGATLVSIQPATGVAVPIGASGFANITGLAFDATAGLLGVDTDPTRSLLLSLDTGSGASSTIGVTGHQTLQGLAFDTNRGAFLATDASTGRLLAIDPATGSVTIIAQLGVALSGLAFDANTSTLYATDTAADTLLSIDTASGATTIIGALGFAEVEGLAFDPRTNTLYGTDTASDLLISIGTLDGAGTAIGALGFDSVRGLAFDPNANLLIGVDGDQILTIDTDTGAAALLGATTGNLILNGLAIQP